VFVLPLLLVVAFLSIARRSVRQANEEYWQAVAGPATSEQGSSVVVRRSAARVDAARAVDDDEPTVALTADQRARAAAAAAEQRVDAVTLQTPDGGSLWDPLPVTLPTYVGAPIAARTLRTIDIGTAASSGHHQAGDEMTATATSSVERAAGSATPTAPQTDSGSGDVARAVNG
jgi:hypothetical protein